jgi:very-short-patch-repair endonuclease
MNRESRHRIKPQLTKRARTFRKESTFPEKLLWGMLRSGRLEDLKFRRQYQVGPFVADFCCASVKLIVEVDGDSHAGTGARDDARTKVLEKLGFKIIRVTNDDILQSKEAVTSLILNTVKEMEARPSPLPSP